MKTDRKNAKKESRAENAKKVNIWNKQPTRVLDRQIKQKKNFLFLSFFARHHVYLIFNVLIIHADV